jgi:chemotaxis protein MotA
MTLLNLIGFIVCTAILLASFIFDENQALYYNTTALMIVLGGTFGVMFISYPAQRIFSSFIVMRRTYLANLPTEAEIVNALLDFALKSKYDGVLSLEEETDRSTTLFLKDGLNMIVDGYHSDEIRDVLGTEMHFFRQRREQSERIFRSMARAAPAFGLIGSVIGLMGMLTGVGDAGVIIKTIPVALVSTLYGILFGSFVFTPIAESIYARTQSELLLANVILNGLVAINNEQDTYKLERKLCSFLTPAVRPVHEKSFQDLRRQYFVLKQQKGKKEGLPATPLIERTKGRRGK